MFKKLASLLLSMLLCLSLLPAQACASDAPAPADPTAITETTDPETPENPEEQIMTMAATGSMPHDEEVPHEV